MTTPRARNGSAVRIFDPLGYCVLADDKGEASARLYGPVWMAVTSPGCIEFMVDTGSPESTFTFVRDSVGAILLRICDSDSVTLLNGPLPDLAYRRMYRRDTVKMSQWEFYDHMA